MVDYKQLELWRQLWTNRKGIAVTISERRELATLKLLHSIHWGQKFLPKCIIPERTRYTDIRFKPIYGRVSCYNNSFIPCTVKQWNLLPPEVVNI